MKKQITKKRLVVVAILISIIATVWQNIDDMEPETLLELQDVIEQEDVSGFNEGRPWFYLNLGQIALVDKANPYEATVLGHLDMSRREWLNSCPGEVAWSIDGKLYKHRASGIIALPSGKNKHAAVLVPILPEQARGLKLLKLGEG